MSSNSLVKSSQSGDKKNAVKDNMMIAEMIRPAMANPLPFCFLAIATINPIRDKRNPIGHVIPRQPSPIRDKTKPATHSPFFFSFLTTG